MATFGMWKETTVNMNAGLNTINLDPATNVIKIINEDVLGSVLYLSTHSAVTQDRYEEKAEVGASTSIVRTRPLGTAYVFNPSPTSVTVIMIEIQTDDIGFLFNASNQVNIVGQLVSDGLKIEQLKVAGDRTLFVTDTSAQAKLDTLISSMTTNNIKLDSLITLMTANNTKLDTLIAKP